MRDLMVFGVEYGGRVRGDALQICKKERETRGGVAGVYDVWGVEKEVDGSRGCVGGVPVGCG